MIVLETRLSVVQLGWFGIGSRLVGIVGGRVVDVMGHRRDEQARKVELGEVLLPLNLRHYPLGEV